VLISVLVSALRCGALSARRKFFVSGRMPSPSERLGLMLWVLLFRTLSPFPIVPDVTVKSHT